MERAGGMGVTQGGWGDVWKNGAGINEMKGKGTPEGQAWEKRGGTQIKDTTTRNAHPRGTWEEA